MIGRMAADGVCRVWVKSRRYTRPGMTAMDGKRSHRIRQVDRILPLAVEPHHGRQIVEPAAETGAGNLFHEEPL